MNRSRWELGTYSFFLWNDCCFSAIEESQTSVLKTKCMWKSISLRFQHKLWANGKTVASEHHQIQTAAHRFNLGQTRLWGLLMNWATVLGCARSWICVTDGLEQKQGCSSMLTATGHVAVSPSFHTYRGSKIPHLDFAHTVWSIVAIRRPVSLSLALFGFNLSVWHQTEIQRAEHEGAAVKNLH